MTEQTPEQTWIGEDDNEGDGAAFGGQTFPEYPYSLADHVYTWSPKLPDGSMLVIRAQTADGLVEAVENMAPLTGRLKAAWAQVSGAPAPAPQAPAQQPWQQQPAQPAPNVPYPGQPAWQQAGAPQAPQQQWGGAPQGQRGGGGQGNKPQPKAQPVGWWRTDKNSGPGADFWKTWREQNQGALKGKIVWGGGSTFWVDPSVVQMVGSAGFAVVAG